MSALFALPILPQLNISSSLWAIAYALLALLLPSFLSFCGVLIVTFQS